MSQQATIADLVSFRRDLHRHPEPAWREFYTTARIVDELETRDLDALYVGPEILDDDERMAVPDDDELGKWFERARDAGARADILERLAGGYTGAVAVLERGEGPTVGLRVDIDALPITESDDSDHLPAAEGFRSENEGFMHACGHDAHATVGLGVLDAVSDSDFQGTFKVFFQPSEELVAGGKAVAEGGHLDDVDYLLALHVGLDHPTGEVVCGVDGFLAVSHFRAEFTGAPAHAGAKPEAGHNTNLAAAAAIQNLYGISRHSDGATRVNVGLMGGGTATNIIAEESFIEGEVRGETTELMEYMEDRAHTVIESAAEMHDCDVDIAVEGKAPSARSDDALATIVGRVSEGVDGVESILESDELGGSEDATYLMQHVQDQGGLAAYVGVGTDHPGGHHTRTFDVDEETIRIAVDVLSESIGRIAADQP
ncbi:amidohydrolase [Haloferax mediterranei ATCC 33500]|uniref:Amidohydrolase n=1 Tax=Haloferax mediterranei (strain ATCC 33500 / DSM 1411 / JCM 8866 / NBRC 14739 / NCIMB 2177 / R-4) TaxID=523841 RepID=I3R4L9_HALMT|nr:amidohydrolase [Haloferax mediterranei]AFK19179.1 N-acyl-L-amino acid amidohydrolase [Haloferax mediterranei ATCC 33500]AHZ21458.1 N-acyl-L-amino acid amidohydrolase [Haloferax mediterranei ATCC 33500]EMA03918.1 N-acyl-L-amino acid amidohydrolase [Haloferax mediterranei ATCC 33500]MDX5989278.1 amidohydrolase [Haloferax mediterranei ATCC 33500]QCQ75649.1 amidohydrolase [Haloferax mediterranei ATCC 33500]